MAGNTTECIDYDNSNEAGGRSTGIGKAGQDLVELLEVQLMGARRRDQAVLFLLGLRFLLLFHDNAHTSQPIWLSVKSPLAT